MADTNRVIPPIAVTAKIEGMENLAQHMSQSITTIAAVQRVLRDHGKILQARAVQNVSGKVMSFNGVNFVVNRVTGKLARSIQVIDTQPLSVTVEAGAKYSGTIELGTRGPTDLKKTKLAGKIVPLPVSNSQGKLLSSPTGAHVLSIFVGRFTTKQVFKSYGKTWAQSGFKENPQAATTGTAQGSQYIMFRRVPGPGGKGWIIPQKAPRPFMAEAAAYTLPLLADAVSKAFADHLTGNATP